MLEKHPQLADAMRLANIPSLLLVLTQLTGDASWLEDPFTPTRAPGISDHDTGGLALEVQEQIRQAARVAIEEFLAGRPVAMPSPSRDELRSMLAVSVGEEVPQEYGALLEAELLGQQPRRDIRAPADFSVVIVGAGFAGMTAAHLLHEAGVAVTVVEQNASVGGVWFENSYPGAGVDTPSHLYSLSFARRNWRHFFALRDEVREYLEDLATELGLRPFIRTSTRVVRATFDAADATWLVDVRTAGGDVETLRASAIVSAVGIFNPPITPAIPGLEDFPGPCFHTAQWPAGVDLTDRRVAVLGTGASAMQVVPAVVDRVKSLVVFQRSRQWALPFEKLRQPVPEAIRWLMGAVPLYARWYRARLGWAFNDRIHSVLHIDPMWEHPDRSINAVNDRQRAFMTAYIESELGDRQDLLPRVLPTYPPFGKRILLDNGWFRALTRDHVTLVEHPVEEVRGQTIVSSQGEEHEVDVIVLATGFDVTHFVSAFEVVGRNGIELRERWGGDDGSAYLGTVVPGFPNFFCLYGPNLQPGHGGSVILPIERQVNFIIDALACLFEREARTVEVTEHAHSSYNEATADRLNRMVWAHPGMTTYYRNSKGRNVVNSPYRHGEWWHMTEALTPTDFLFEP